MALVLNLLTAIGDTSQKSYPIRDRLHGGVRFLFTHTISLKVFLPSLSPSPVLSPLHLGLVTQSHMKQMGYNIMLHQCKIPFFQKNPPGCLYSDVRWWSTSCPVLMYLATSFMFHCSFNWTSAICHAVAWLVYWFSGMTMKCDFMEEKEAPGERITRA